MNYLAHMKIADSENALINFGSIIPDILSSLEVKKSHVESFYPAKDNLLIKGIKIHILSDKIFHSKEYCMEEQKKIPQTKKFAEHFLLELCIDNLILNSEYEQICKKINSINKLISSENEEIKGLENYLEFDKEFSEKFYERTENTLEYILSYKNEEGIIDGVNRILTRMKLEKIPKEKFYLNAISNAIQNIKPSYLKMLESIKERIYLNQ